MCRIVQSVYGIDTACCVGSLLVDKIDRVDKVYRVYKVYRVDRNFLHGLLFILYIPDLLYILI